MFDLHPFQLHAEEPLGEGACVDGISARAGSVSECGREISVRLRLVDGQLEAGFDAEGCSAMTAVGSAVCTLVNGANVREAGLIGADRIADELGGLATKRYAAEFAADALAWSLGRLVMTLPADDPGPIGTAIALSGGVDSAVALELLADEQPVALTVELWRDDQTDPTLSCCSASTVRLARAVAHRRGVPHFTVDLRDEFRQGVVAPWIEAARRGDVGNPCVSCNGHVRLDGMLRVAQALGVGRLATGHYALTTEPNDGRAYLRANPDPRRDQSYMLAALSPETVARMRFPLGGMDKANVRRIAAERGVAVADRPDSQDLCFLSGEGKLAFLERVGGLRERPGDFVTTEGETIGTHRGAHLYTIGQRRGIGIGGHQEPLRVIDVDGRNNRVTVGTMADLQVDSVRVRGLSLHEAGVDGIRLRSHGEVVPASVSAEPGHHRETTILLGRSVERPSPGQSACLMRGETVIGQATVARIR